MHKVTTCDGFLRSAFCILHSSAPCRVVPGGGLWPQAGLAVTTSPRSCVPTRPRAFTLIELLVVIIVIGVLIAAVAIVGGRGVRVQKVRVTENIMRAVKVAIDQFAETDPLASVYNRKDAKTFGPYPPYMLDGADDGPPVNSVREALEPYSVYSQCGSFSYVLEDRLHRDLGNRQGSYTAWVRLDQDPNQGENDDIRALYAYLRLYVPDALSQVSKEATRPLGATPEYVNPTGTGTDPGQPGNAWIDVLGIFDAWGVPLNYMLYVKLEWTLGPTGQGQWVVADRIPVLMSHGHTLEEHEAQHGGSGQEHELEHALFSDPLPSPPAAGVNAETGELVGTGAVNAGWARAKAAGEEYDYLP